MIPLFALLVVSAAAQTKLGEVRVEVANTVQVRVSSPTPELNTVALQAFRSHGHYKVVANRFAYDIRFNAVGPNQVRVDILNASGGAVASETASGATLRQAMLRAADLAVERTNGVGLRGYFSSRIAFIGERGGKKDVYVADLFMGEMKQVTHDRALALTPRWRPDGGKLIYTSFYKGGFPDIFLLDPESGQKETFVSVRGTNSGARFSPDGQHVAMVLTGTGTPEIWLANARGGAPVRKTRSDAVKSSPCWSPDGSQILFAMEPGPQLYVMPSAGGAPQRLSAGYSYAAEPDWSRANPSKIACTIREGARYQLAVFDRAKGSASKVSQAPFDAIEPSWLPDGRHLVYTARDRATSVLCILDTETGNSTPLIANMPQQFGPAMQASVFAR